MHVLVFYTLGCSAFPVFTDCLVKVVIGISAVVVTFILRTVILSFYYLYNYVHRVHNVPVTIYKY